MRQYDIIADQTAAPPAGARNPVLSLFLSGLVTLLAALTMSLTG